MWSLALSSSSFAFRDCIALLFGERCIALLFGERCSVEKWLTDDDGPEPVRIAAQTIDFGLRRGR